MAVLDNIDTNAIIKGIQGMATQDSGGVLGGQVGAVLLGALLPRLLGTGLGVDAALAHKPLDANDVQNIVAANTNSQTLGTLKGEVWQAEGQVQNAISSASNTATVQTLQAEIANLQGQGLITKSISDMGVQTAAQTNLTNGLVTDVARSLSSEHAVTNALVNTSAANVMQGLNLIQSSTANSFNHLNTAVLESQYELAKVTADEAEKTRAEIRALKDTIPNARELDLQRQLTVALDDDRHNRLRGIIDSGNVNVTTNVNQNQAQAQQQQQLQTLTTGLALLSQNQQHATNLAINTGGNQRFNGSATNVSGV